MFNQFCVCVFFVISSFLVSRLMGGSASGSMGHMGNMGSLAACSVSDSKPMQFPLAQRRKRRVLFTQAQVCPKEMLIFFYFILSLVISYFTWRKCIANLYNQLSTATYCNPFEANCYLC